MKTRHSAALFVASCVSIALLIFNISSTASAAVIPDTSFESGSLSGWSIGSQTGTFTGGAISGTGTGVTAFSGSVTFNAPSGSAVGSPTLGDGSPNPYYQPAIDPAVWSFSPYGTYGAALQPNGQQQFDDAMTALGIDSSDEASMRSELISQASASTYGSGNPTDAAWITRLVSLNAGTTYTMSWNYIGTDYVPFNDGSITSLVPVSGTATVSVNNSGDNYALLGFTNPGTGDYSTGTYGSTGWQMSTYQVSVTGDYVLGFAVFNLDDTALSPVLLIDSQPGSTTKNGDDFGAVPPNNSDAPTIPPTTDAPVETDPPVTDVPVETDPPATDVPVETDPPTTDVPVETDPPVTDVPVDTDPPVTDVPDTTEPDDEETITTDAPDRPRQSTTTTTSTPELVVTTTLPSVDDSTIPPSTNLPTLPVTGSSTDFSGLIAFILLVLGVSTYRLSRKKK